MLKVDKTKESEGMTPAQCRAARAALDMSQADLASASGGMQVMTVSDYEKGITKLQQRTREKLVRAFEERGITLAADGLGVRWKA